MTELNESFDGAQPAGVSRRTVTKAMAWAVPVIAVSAAVPAYAASQGVLALTGEGCKLPGNSQETYKGYALGVSAKNTFNVPITITLNSLALNNISLGSIKVIDLNTCTVLGVDSFVVGANQTLSNLVFLTAGAGNSQQGTLTGSYTITGGPGGTQTVSAQANVVPPVQGGACTDFNATEKACIEGNLV